MPTTTFGGRTFDARPDRVDLRDRPYLPRLVSLPAQYPSPRVAADYLPRYTADKMVLDQGQEGACTGFGLAAVINYLQWRRAVEGGAAPPEKVSAGMLYHLARFYDEWPGEDYEGSSCRGAMKGWHRHGVCRLDTWPSTYHLHGTGPEGWEADAAARPLGAYYRIDKDSIVDMQAAIAEVGAVYASASVHDGWMTVARVSLSADLPVITAPARRELTGGHAFALVGYTADGFIVQNSWGPEWGRGGFAILPYGDWVTDGSDAWVAALGAPVRSSAAATGAPGTLQVPAAWPGARADAYGYTTAAYRAWDDATALRHSIVMGNNGVTLNRLPTCATALDALAQVVFEEPKKSMDQDGVTRVLLYAHGGLNSEDASLKRVTVLAPYFRANGIHPIFFTWKTGVRETLEGIIEDHLKSLVPARGIRDVWETVKDTVSEANDRLIEAACQSLRIKAVWSEMKQNAAAAATEPRPTLGLTVQHLARLRAAAQAQGRQLELHLVGHSAGSILLGHLLDLLASSEWTGGAPLGVATCSLFAPACTVRFALDHYVPAEANGVLKGASTVVESLTDARERADRVGPYGKSLLYLISRGLEDYHKTPVLGLQTVSGGQAGLWGNAALEKDVADWSHARRDAPGVRLRGDQEGHDGRGSFAWVHGAFDNDVGSIGDVLTRIGVTSVGPIENLRGY